MTTAVLGSLSTALTDALSGLNVSQQQLSVTSNNIANVNTPGYSRQVANISEDIVAGQGEGATLDSITREVDQFLQRSLQQQNSVVSNATVLNQYATSIQNLLGQPTGGTTTTTDTSIASAITSFFTSLQQLAATPTDPSLQVTAVQSGQDAAQQISSLASGLENLRYQADQQIGQDVGTINTVLQQLQSTNTALGTATINGGNTADLEDQRDNLVNQLSQYLDINYYYDSNNEVHVTTNGGVPLLDGGQLYQLSYSGQPSAQSFTNNAAMNPLNVYAVDASGNQVPPAMALASGGQSSSVTTSMTTGEIRGLLDIRDTQIPQMLNQLDQLASTLENQVNAVNNEGSSFPGSNSYTGQRLVSALQSTGWSGSVQIALLNNQGQPVTSPYPNSTAGLPPLNLNLGSLNSGNGAGFPTTQSIINSINSYFQPQNTASIGDLSNVQLASDSSALPGGTNQFNFDFNLQNLSQNSSNFFVSNVTVTDDQGNSVGAVSSTQPVISLASSNTYTTTAGSHTVTVNTAAAVPQNLQNGDYVYLSNPGGTVDGIPGSQLGGYFQVTNVSGSSFQINVAAEAQNGGNFTVAGQTATPEYQTVDAGQTTRTGGNGVFNVSLASNTTSSYYTVTANVATQNADGTLSIGTVSYKVLNPAVNSMNALYGASSASGEVAVTPPSSYTPLATAELVDANGNPLPTINGAYTANASGYLKIVAADPNNVISINSGDSEEIGFPNLNPPQPGTNRNFSYYFGLNNFFNENQPTTTGDTITNSAINMSVVSSLAQNPSLISTGTLTQSPPAANGDTLYTYERSAGDNSIINQMANLGSSNFLFGAAGGLGNSTATFNGYAGEIIGYASAQATTIQSNLTNATTIQQGLQSQQSQVSGVNMDEELANTIIYQNAYTASAHIISITDTLFSTLLQSVQT